MGTAVAVTLRGVGTAELCIRSYGTGQSCFFGNARRRHEGAACATRRRSWPDGRMYPTGVFLEANMGVCVNLH